MARPGIERRTSDLRVLCPTDCATRPGLYIREGFEGKFFLFLNETYVVNVSLKPSWGTVQGGVTVDISIEEINYLSVNLVISPYLEH